MSQTEDQNGRHYLIEFESRVQFYTLLNTTFPLKSKQATRTTNSQQKMLSASRFLGGAIPSANTRVSENHKVPRKERADDVEVQLRLGQFIFTRCP